MNQDQAQGVRIGGQIGGGTANGRDEQYRLMGIRNSALHLAQQNTAQNGSCHDAAAIVKEAEIFFEFLNK